MYRFLESIKVSDGHAFLLKHHQKRVNDTFACFGKENFIDLESILKSISVPSKGLYKFRISYSLNSVCRTELIPYERSEISRFLLVVNDEINYPFKFEDRKGFEAMKVGANGAEIIIVKDNHITDTSFSNLIFLKDNVWFTPSAFLLNGVQRQELLQSGKITTADISPNNLREYSHFKLINALNDFDDALAYPLSRILNLPGKNSVEAEIN